MIGQVGAGHAKLCRLFGRFIEKLKVVELHPGRVRDLRRDLQRLGSVAAGKRRPLAVGAQLNTVKAAQKVIVPNFAPELTVGNCLEANTFLHRNNIADTLVFDGA